MRNVVTQGVEIPVAKRAPDPIDIYMFSAASWLLHRIHYDLPFTTERDGHPGLLIHGPLQGTYMIQSVQWWLGIDVRPTAISYRHWVPAYLGDELECGGSVIEVTEEVFTVELWVRKEGNVVTTSGTATFAWPDA